MLKFTLFHGIIATIIEESEHSYMGNQFDRMAYMPRIIDKIVDEYLENCGAICIEGPKWCGKTWTSAYHSKSEFYVGDPENGFSNRQLAIEKPSMVLKGEKPRMIDEWQEANGLWDATRAEVDRLNMNGAFILTGSTTPKRKGVFHSGAGRIVSLRMSTMSLFETGASSGVISLKDLCNGKIEEQTTGEVNLEDLADMIVRGGWPRNRSNENPTIMPKAYVKNIIDSNLADDEDEYNYNHKTTELILRSLARNESTTFSNSAIMRDISEKDGENISKDTISRYLGALERMFLLENQQPFSPNVRSALRVKQAEKRHFCDPALACALLNLNAQKLVKDLNTMGFLFEALVEHDLNVYSQAMNAKIYHYQNYDNDEIDAVIELEDGEWCAFEIKLGASKIAEGAENLNRVCQKIEKAGMKAPKIKCVICGLSNAAYQRSDGVFVVPLTALKN